MFLSSNNGSKVDCAKNIINQAIQEISADYESQIAELESRGDNAIPVIKTDVKSCSDVTGSFYCDISSYKRKDDFYSSQRTTDEVFTYVTKLLDDAVKKIEEIHAQNIPSLESNKLVRSKLEKLFKSIGLPDSYRERDNKSKARFPKYINVAAGYKADLTRIVVDDNYESALDAVSRKRKQLQEWVDVAKKEERAKQVEAEKKEQEIKKLRSFGIVASRYGLTENNTEYDLLESILAKDKYLRLGHYLLKNRNDSTDGPSYAERGLREFTADSELDKMIATDIQDAIDNWDGDGRCFRDIVCNYSYCFNLVHNEQLRNDYELVKSWLPEY